MKVPPNIAPPTKSFCIRLPLFVGAAGCCRYVRDCLNAFRAFASVLVAVVRDVKKFAAGLELWNDRMGAELKAVFEAPTSVVESFNGCRITNAIVSKVFQEVIESNC